MDTATPLWACLDFPDLAGQAAFGESYVREQPHALDRSDPRGGRIDWLNPAAAAQGVRLGQTGAAATALCPELVLRGRDLATEERQLLALAGWAYCYSPQVAVLPPGRLLLELGNSRRLFGGLGALVGRMRDELVALDQPLRLSLGPNPTAARVLVRVAGVPELIEDAPALQRLLDRLPLASSGLPEAAVELLLGSGFRQLGDLAPLPRAELTRRIGPAGMLHLDQLYGRVREHPTCWQPPDRYEQAIDLAAATHSSQGLLFPLRRLLTELALHLAARDGGVQEFALRLGHPSRPATRLTVGLLAPRRDAAGLFELARMQLERCALPDEVISLAVVAEQLPTLRPVHHDLFEPARSPAQSWTELAERLRARLGPDALSGLAVHADHRPEWAQRMPALGSRAAAEAGIPAGERPLWLLPRPLPLRQPLARILAGPERIESGWWDGGDTRRDYYIVLCRNGQRAWVFAVPGVREEFMLHGWFA